MTKICSHGNVPWGIATQFTSTILQRRRVKSEPAKLGKAIEDLERVLASPKNISYSTYRFLLKSAGNFWVTVYINPHSSGTPWANLPNLSTVEPRWNLPQSHNPEKNYEWSTVRKKREERRKDDLAFLTIRGDWKCETWICGTSMDIPRDMKMQDQLAGVENAGHENAGPICRGGKCGKS